MICRCKHLWLLGAVLLLINCDGKRFARDKQKTSGVADSQAINAELGEKADDGSGEEKIFFPKNISGAYLYCQQSAAYQDDTQSASISCRISQTKDGDKSEIAALEGIKWEMLQADDSKRGLCSAQITKLNPDSEWHISIEFSSSTLEDWRDAMNSYQIIANFDGVVSTTPLLPALISEDQDNKPALFYFQAVPVAEGIELNWQASIGYHALIIRWSEAAPLSETPRPGRLYEMNTPLGNGQIVYNGDASTWLDQSLELGESYSYRLWLRSPQSRYYHDTAQSFHFAKSCQELHLRDLNLPSQDYPIYPTGFNANMSAITASCDMLFDGGGWTLVLNYVRAAGNNADLQVQTANLPLLKPASLLGDDESSLAPHWGHASNSMLANMEFSTLRFWCTADHGRILHFHSDAPGCRAYFQTGSGDCSELGMNRTPYADDNSQLVFENFDGNEGDLAMTKEPFYQFSTSHWNINASFSDTNMNRWECDNVFEDLNTMHRIWVR